ncbi:MAG: hypothetical protein JWP87_5043 [Labilithrix sp.]|nr:hypothetical protein [Labilithrix sp.]
MRRALLLSLFLGAVACDEVEVDAAADRSGDGGANDGAAPADAATPDVPRTERIADRSLIEWMSADPTEPWWIEERIAPQPSQPGDYELGPRSIMRAAPDRRVVWQAPDTERMTDACRHPSGEWSAAGVDADRRVFLARGNADGLLDRVLIEDPELVNDSRAWNSTPRTVPRVWSWSEQSVSVVADGEGVVLALMTEDDAVLAYRFARGNRTFERGPRTLVSPAASRSPFIPIGGSYDDFDAVTAPFLVHLGVEGNGRAFVAQFADSNRIRSHNAKMGTSLELLRDQLYPSERTQDVLVSGFDRDGSVAFATVVGVPDVEDEVFGLAVGEGRVAVLGRHRRELGRDNTEIHVMVAELSAEGAPLATTSFDALDSGLAQTGAYVGSQLWVGGTEGWVQNPSGRSVSGQGQPFLARLRDDPAVQGRRVVERFDPLLPPTGGHAELRALRVRTTSAGATSLFMGGHENGPQTHTGDGDPSLIRSDAWWRLQPL